MTLEELSQKYPTVLGNTYLECNAGWANILDAFLQEVIATDPTTKIAQIKEKFGGLRIYCDEYNADIDKLIQKVEEKSFNICEQCGAKGRLRRQAWWKTLCDDCDDSRKCTKVL